MKLLLIALLCGLMGSVVGLKCYLCDDGFLGTSPGCPDPFNKTTTDSSVQEQSCPVGTNTCSKSYLNTADQSFTVRGCVDSSLCLQGDNACASYDNQGESATLCCCNTDFCNGAEAVSVNLLAATAVGLAALLFAL